ncbi:CoF synthetase [Seonamhaeicola sp. ML3]|uniref:CoF synthetase n=1 Tax=Seonamhaeicola sp. ML3 TaxID=2937786 RepID=UPI0020100293|nr:CoF synthetase [Seonamhaeicola sp. ML3]
MKYIIHLLEHLRRFSFWTQDFIKGQKTRKHYREILNLNEDFTNPSNIKIRENHLDNILGHAVSTTSFYSDYNNYKSLSDFPVINKNIIRENQKAMASQKFMNRKNKIVSTSGSTGANLSVAHNRDKSLRNTADTIYFSEKAGFKIGHKLIFLRHWDDELRKSRLKNFILNIQEEEIFGFTGNRISELLIQAEKDTSNKGLIAYASGLELICKHLDNFNGKLPTIKFKSIIAISEHLNDYTKNALNKYFNVQAVSRYSNTENGIIAQQNIEGDLSFNINWASYYVEILDIHKNIPARNMEMGRIVITDLFNFATPLIRYDTGDVGCMDYSVTPPVLKKIEGRKGDIIFNTKGEIVTHFIVTNLSLYSNVKQGQLIQTDKTVYTLKLNVNPNFNKEGEILNLFKGFLGEDASINIKYVDEIPVLSSGKRRLTINEYTV